MALNINKLARHRNSGDGFAVKEVQGDVIKWLHDHIGNLRSVEERSYMFKCSCIHYKGEGWEITPPRAWYRDINHMPYQLIIDDDAQAIHFKLIWL
jgi:hypothetical protein